MTKIVIVPNDLQKEVNAVDENIVLADFVKRLNELEHKINVLNDKLLGLKETIDYLSETIIDVYNEIDAVNARLDKCNCPK